MAGHGEFLMQIQHGGLALRVAVEGRGLRSQSQSKDCCLGSSHFCLSFAFQLFLSYSQSIVSVAVAAATNATNVHAVAAVRVRRTVRGAVRASVRCEGGSAVAACPKLNQHF